MNKYQEIRIKCLSKEPITDKNYEALCKFEEENFKHDFANAIRFAKFDISPDVMKYFIEYPNEVEKKPFYILDLSSYKLAWRKHVDIEIAFNLKNDQLTLYPYKQIRYIANQNWIVFTNPKNIPNKFIHQKISPLRLTKAAIQMIIALRKSKVTFGNIYDINEAIFRNTETTQKIKNLIENNEIEKLALLAFDLSTNKDTTNPYWFNKENFVIAAIHKSKKTDHIIEKYKLKWYNDIYEKSLTNDMPTYGVSFKTRNSLLANAVWELSAIKRTLPNWYITINRHPVPAAIKGFYKTHKNKQGWVRMKKKNIPTTVKRQYYFKRIIVKKDNDPKMIKIKLL